MLFFVNRESNAYQPKNCRSSTMNCTLWTDLSKILKGNFMKRSLCQRPDEVQSDRCLFLNSANRRYNANFRLFLFNLPRNSVFFTLCEQLLEWFTLKVRGFSTNIFPGSLFDKTLCFLLILTFILF